MGVGVGGRLKTEGTCGHRQLIHIGIQQKLMQHSKAIIFQLKNELQKPTVLFP